MAPLATHRRILLEGAFGGLFGGAFFAALQILAAAFAGFHPAAPWQLAASLTMGEKALHGGASVGVFFAGLLAHFGLATVFGLGFGAITAALGPRRRDSYGFEVPLGGMYGLVLWVINFRLVVPLLYPWLQLASLPAELAIHVFGYGIPMGAWVCLRLRDIEVPGVHRLRHRLQTSSGDEETEHYRRDLEVQRAERARGRGHRP